MPPETDRIEGALSCPGQVIAVLHSDQPEAEAPTPGERAGALVLGVAVRARQGPDLEAYGESANRNQAPFRVCERMTSQEGED